VKETAVPVYSSSPFGGADIQIADYDVYYKKGNENTWRLFAKNLERSVLMAAR
jgi:L-ribulose-5-phosphate 3-epimerase UlaE